MYTNGIERKSHRDLQNALGISFPRHSPPQGWEVVQPTPPPEPTLDELKARKRREIDAEREQAIEAGTTHNGISVQTRRQDRQNIQGMGTAAQLRITQNDATPMTFRDADDVNHDLTPSEIIAMGVAVMTHVQAQYEKSWALKDEVEAATDEAGVEAVAWTAS